MSGVFDTRIMTFCNSAYLTVPTTSIVLRKLCIYVMHKQSQLRSNMKFACYRVLGSNVIATLGSILDSQLS